MSNSAGDKYYWQGPRIRLRAMTREDLEVWLAEDTDTEGIRHLAYAVELPKSPPAADEFAARFAHFGGTDERIMFTIETLDGEVVGGRPL